MDSSGLEALPQTQARVVFVSAVRAVQIRPRRWRILIVLRDLLDRLQQPQVVVEIETVMSQDGAELADSRRTLSVPLGERIQQGFRFPVAIGALPSAAGTAFVPWHQARRQFAAALHAGSN